MRARSRLFVSFLIVSGLCLAGGLALAQSQSSADRQARRGATPAKLAPAPIARDTATFQFDAGEIELVELIHKFAAGFGLPAVGEAPPGKLSLAGTEPLDYAQALAYLRELVFSQSRNDPFLVLIRDGQLHVTRAADIPRTLTLDRIFPTVSDFETAEIEDWEPIIVQYTPPRDADFDLPMIRQLLPDYMRVSQVPGASAVSVFAIARDIRRFVELADRFDAAPPSATDSAQPSSSQQPSPTPAAKTASERRAEAAKKRAERDAVRSAVALAAPATQPAGDASTQSDRSVHVDVVVYRVEGPIDRLIEIDGAALSATASSDAQKALAAFGTVRPLYRLSQLADLRMKNRMVIGTRMPFVRNLNVTNTGQMQSQVEYQDIGAECQFTGEWVGEQVSARIEIELSGLSTSGVAIAERVNAPVFPSIKQSLSGLIEPGRPAFLVSVDGASSTGTAPAVAHVARVLLTATP